MRPNNRHRTPRFSTAPRIRAGLLTSRNMDYAGVADVEALMAEEGLTPAPITAEGRVVERVVGPAHATVTVLPTATAADAASGALAGIVVPAAAGLSAADGETILTDVVAAAREGEIPVMAFGDGVAPTLEAAGFEAPDTPPQAVLLHNGVLILETPDDVRAALRTFAEARAARLAA
ncbi:MAG: hypothetical protein ACOY5Y_06630 [Pseudomonadota bacterium]|jgi:hypothetical protein